MIVRFRGRCRTRVTLMPAALAPVPFLLGTGEPARAGASIKVTRDGAAIQGRKGVAIMRPSGVYLVPEPFQPREVSS